MILSGISAETKVSIAFGGILRFLFSHSRKWT